MHSRARIAVLLGAAAVALQLLCVSSECQGDTCREHEIAASRSGLLGGTQMAKCAAGTRTFAFDPKWMTTFESEIYTTVWAGDDDEWVWAITSGARSVAQDPHHVWLSSDHGRTFHDLFPTLLAAIKTLVGDQYDSLYDPEHASVGKIYVNAGNPRSVLLWGDGLYLFRTHDGGATFEALYTPSDTLGFSHTVRPHPTQADWLLTMAYRNACYSFDPVGCELDLFLTNDFGANWKNLTAGAGPEIRGFTDFDWGYHNGDEKYRALYSERTILASAHVTDKAGLYAGAANDVHLYQSDDDFKHSQLLIQCGNAFELLAGQVFLARPANCPVDINGKAVKAPDVRDRHIKLFVSEDGRNFGEVCLPTPLGDKGYTMVSSHDRHGAFVIADHDPVADVGSQVVSNMYANGHISELFSLSLRNLYFGIPRGGFPDVSAIEPIPGRYIANQELSTNPQSPYIMSDPNLRNTVIVTKITHNSGASWDYIVVDPATVKHEICRGSCTTPASCYLHLHGFSSWKGSDTGRPAVYAAKYAPGIVMASGNLGPEMEGLQTDKDKLCTWLSRDGGVTWTDVIDDLYIYEYLNHGNVIAMAKFREEGPADELLVTLDQGVCWWHINLLDPASNSTLLVNNIRVEPDGAAAILHLTGTLHFADGGDFGMDSTQSVMLTIDLREVLSRADVDGRVLAPRQGCNSHSDLEEWVVGTLDEGPECILGQRHTFRRRAAFATADPCLLDKAFNMTIPEGATPCDCAQEDLYCEYGYEKMTSSKCGPMLFGQPPVCAAIAADYYTMSSTHLRLTHHETCPNLSSFIPDTDGSGNMKDKRNWNKPFERKRKSGGLGWFWKLLLVLLGLGGAIAAFCKFAPEEYKDKVYLVTEPLIGGAMWAAESVQKLFQRVANRNAAHEHYGFEPLGASGDDHLYAAP